MEFDSEQGGKFSLVLDHMAGIGATSCVYKCTLTESCTTDGITTEKTMAAAAKFVSDFSTYASEKIVYQAISRFDIGPKLYQWKDLKNFFVLEFASPVSASCHMKAEHFHQLLDRLSKFHSLGYVHRDVRLSNILISDERGALLSDFGFAIPQDICVRYSGSQETASQRIYASILNNCDALVCFTPEDDYESLFKSFLIWAHGLSDQISNLIEYDKLFAFWNNYMWYYFRESGFPQSSDAWKTFLQSLFSNQDPSELNFGNE